MELGDCATIAGMRFHHIGRSLNMIDSVLISGPWRWSSLRGSHG